MRRLLSGSCGIEQYQHAAPVIPNVLVSDLYQSQRSIGFDGLVDTGAGRTAIPLDLIAALRIKVHDYGIVRTADAGNASTYRPRVWIHLHVPEFDASRLLVWALPRATILLGRDFLSRYLLLCDFPAKQFSLVECGTSRRLGLRVMGL